MKVTASLIERFFRNELNDSQTELVKDYFRQHPEALQSWLTDKSWDGFNPDRRLDQPISDKMLRYIEAGIDNRKRTRSIYYRRAAVAAAILLLFITGIGYHFEKHAGKGVAPVTIAAAGKASGDKKYWRDEVNKGQRIKHLSLADGSEVELAAGSRIQYLDSFAPDKRDVYLSGSALFKVGKDGARPFTVYTGHLHVTALGTVFRVLNADAVSKKKEVHLLSGKVVVRPDSLLAEKGIKEVYLVPGQSLLLDEQKYMLTLLRSGQREGADPRKPILVIPTLQRTFTFDNEPLAAVFEDLSKNYRIRFIYNGDNLKGMNFTGKFNNQKESLESFLNTISILNGLTIRVRKNGVYIAQ